MRHISLSISSLASSAETAASRSPPLSPNPASRGQKDSRRIGTRTRRSSRHRPPSRSCGILRWSDSYSSRRRSNIGWPLPDAPVRADPSTVSSPPQHLGRRVPSTALICISRIPVLGTSRIRALPCSQLDSRLRRMSTWRGMWGGTRGRSGYGRSVGWHRGQS